MTEGFLDLANNPCGYVHCNCINLVKDVEASGSRASESVDPQFLCVVSFPLASLAVWG